MDTFSNQYFSLLSQIIPRIRVDLQPSKEEIVFSNRRDKKRFHRVRLYIHNTAFRKITKFFYLLKVLNFILSKKTKISIYFCTTTLSSK